MDSIRPSDIAVLYNAFSLQPIQTPSIKDRITQLRGMVVAQSTATALSAKTISRVASKTQRERDFMDIKFNLEHHLHDSISKGLPRSPSLPCLSNLRRHQECPSPFALVTAKYIQTQSVVY